jgi:AraC-like DNA-binding protein
MKRRNRSSRIADTLTLISLRRAFARHVGVTPAEYRKRFARIVA